MLLGRGINGTATAMALLVRGLRFLGVVLLLSWVASPVSAQVGHNGYIGIYAEPNGATPCTQIGQYQGAVLYLVAKVDGLTASGITGAEFRVEVTNPAGWTFYPTFYNSPTTVGSDLMGTGITLAYASCRVPDSVMAIPVGEILAINWTGGPTNLLIKSRSTPSNPAYSCPLLVACDAPIYTKACMTPTTEPPCSLTVPPKPVASTASDPTVFTFALNPNLAVEPLPPPEPFRERSVALGNSSLWVAGRKVSGSQIRVHFEGGFLLFNDEAVTLEPRAREPRPDSLLERKWGTVPRVRELVQQGLPWETALVGYSAEINALIDRAALAYARTGVLGALALLRSQAMVEDVLLLPEDELLVRFRGQTGKLRVNLTDEIQGLRNRPQVPPPRRRSKELVAISIAHDVEQLLRAGRLVIITGGGSYVYFSGVEAAQAEAQLLHVSTGQPLDALPAGPLDKAGYILTEAVAARAR